MNNKRDHQESDFEETLLRMDSVELDKEFAQKNPKRIIAISRFQLIYSILGVILGSVCVIFGGYLSLNVFLNESKLLITVMGMKSEIRDAGPGVILFVVGLFIVYISRFKVRVK